MRKVGKGMDMEKVIKSLKWFRDRDKWIEGIMIHDDHAEVRKQICDNALALLKEQQEQIDRLLEENASNAEMAEGLKELLKEQEERWIPVTERLPRSIANKVLVYVQHEDYVGYIGYGHYEKYKGQEMWFDLEHDEEFSKRGYTVTHWMETPMPPMEGR